MSRTKKFFFNSMSTAIMQIVTMLAGLITLRIMLRYFGSEINGLVSSVSQIIAYFNLVEAGLSGAAIYALYKPLADNDHKAINGVVAAAKRFYTQSGYIFVLLILGLSILYPIFVKLSILSPFYVRILILIIGANGALEFYILARYKVLLSADQRTYVISIISIVQIILNTLIIVILTKFNINIVTLKAITLIILILRPFILQKYIKKKYKYINNKDKPNNKALNKRWDVLYLQILGSTQIGVPIILATIFTSLQTISIYSIYNMVMGGINGILSIFISGLSASFGDIISRGEKKTLQKSYSEFEFSYYSLITIVYSIAMVTIMSFIRIYTSGVTDANYYLPLLGFLFVLNGWLYNVKTPQGMLVISAGMFKETKIQSTVQAIIIIVAGSILAPKYEIIGILIALCLSNIYRDFDLLFFVSRNVTGLPVKGTALRILRMVLEIIIICVPFKFIELDINNLVQWLLNAVAVGVYAIVVVGIFGIAFDKMQLKSVLMRVQSIFIRS